MRNLYTLEVRYGGRWELFDVYPALRDARDYRDRLCQGYVTRIQKWVKPCKKTHR